MKLNVVKNAKKNLAAGVLAKVVAMVCPIITRPIMLGVFGAEYLGLGSLFHSVLTVLSLSELGFGSAIVYNMYKPVAENDVTTVNAILNFYRKVYRVIGCAVLGIGICLTPFLPHLISGSHPEEVNIFFLYFIYLGNAAISYFMFAYKSSLIVVHQRSDITSVTQTAVTLIQTAVQIIVVLNIRSYYLYALAMPVFTVVNNLRIALIVRNMYPQYRPEGKLSSGIINGIKYQVGGAFISKACGVSRNALDSICISAFLGLSLTAKYNSYLSIVASVKSFPELISGAFQGGVGNHMATRSRAENFDEMSKLDFCYMWVTGWCAICLVCLFQPFMELWLGKEMLLSNTVVVLLALYFYLLGVGDMRYIYTAAGGLWWQQRYRAAAELVLNVTLNIVLSRFWGVIGIILATIITIIMNQIWAAIITFKGYFGMEYLGRFARYHAKYFVVSAALCAATYAFCSLARFKNLFAVLVVRAVFCVAVPNMGYFLLYRKSENFKYLLNKIGLARLFRGKRYD